jgi:hypothetical protein
MMFCFQAIKHEEKLRSPYVDGSVVPRSRVMRIRNNLMACC